MYKYFEIASTLKGKLIFDFMVKQFNAAKLPWLMDPFI